MSQVVVACTQDSWRQVGKRAQSQRGRTVSSSVIFWRCSFNFLHSRASASKDDSPSCSCCWCNRLCTCARACCRCCPSLCHRSSTCPWLCWLPDVLPATTSSRRAPRGIRTPTSTAAIPAGSEQATSHHTTTTRMFVGRCRTAHGASPWLSPVTARSCGIASASAGLDRVRISDNPKHTSVHH